MTASIKTIFHKTTGLEINVEGKTNSAIIAEIKKAGFTLGAKSLAAMLKGDVEAAGDFTTVKPEVKAEEPAVAAAAADTTSGDEVEQLAAPVAPVTKEVRAKKPTLRERVLAAGALAPLAPNLDALEKLDPTAREIAEKELAEQREAALKADKFSFRGTDWSKVLPQSPVAVKEGTKIHGLLVYLTTPGGVTKDEIMTKFGWSAGGLAGILHWEPKAKGYALISEKGGDDKLRYSLAFIGSGGRRVKPEEVLVKAAAAPKAPKAPKAAAPEGTPEDAPAVKKVRVPKNGMDAVGVLMAALGGSSVTKRVAAKKS